MTEESKETRIASIGGLWFLATLALSAVFLGAGLQGELTLVHIVFACAILALACIATPILIHWFNSNSDVVKAKREKIDTMLRDMSDDELMELKQRLSDGDYSDESLLEYVSDDGELVFRS